ncbi:MAG: cysteine desulfurase, partial [Planctomycetes bacterium]|nr:cysteine desulfurase [Planctomycetota bacterium]
MAIYLDHNSTTPTPPAVWEAMRPYLSETFGNPSSSHSFGRKARQALEDAREKIAHLLDAFPDEVIFASGATEANNLALFGLAGDPPGRILASGIEHPCIIEPLKQLAARGFTVDWMTVKSSGCVGLDEPVHPDTRLATLMLVNHETGAIQPVAEAVKLLPKALVHTDAAQAVGKIPVSFHKLGVTSLSASGHKFGAPKGIGLLLLRRDAKLRPQIFGGHQQQGRRPGTEPVALAVGLAKALELAVARQAFAHVQRLRTEFKSRLESGASPVVFNSPVDGSPYVLNVSFPGCRADL